MIKLGKVQKLKIKRITKDGAFVNEENESGNDVLLPLNQLSRSMKTDDEIDVFVYVDSNHNVVATTQAVKITLGEIAILKVMDLNKVGAFLDWGLDKQLFLPYAEQTYQVRKGDEVMVALYIDSTDRLCATMNVYEVLKHDSPYQVNDRVKGIIYKIHPQYGAFVAVDQRYHGLVPNKELYGNYAEGNTIEARVKKVREDGKLELALRDSAAKEIVNDSDKIIQKLQLRNGRLSLHDKSDAEKIKAELDMSKAAFKRAIGKLYKEGLITIHTTGIELTKKSK